MNRFVNSRGFVENNSRIIASASHKWFRSFRGDFNRKNGNNRRFSPRTERIKVNIANRFDIIAEKFDSVRRLGVNWENIDNAAVHAEFSDSVNVVGMFVAEIDKLRNEFSALNFIAGRNSQLKF